MAMTALAGIGGSATAQEPEGGLVDLGVQADPVRFTAEEGVVMELGSGRRLVDTVELRRSPLGGMVVVGVMDMDEYVAGVAEMPSRWPMEALKAQAVAARTYAWYQASLHTFEERGLGYDICASTACQVFEGHTVVEEPVVGQRWQRAVRETSGEVLLHEGEPILARYFSTSGGRTRNNEVVFPSSGPRPYLKGIEDPDDAVSPFHRWQATFTRDQFDRLAARGETLGSAAPIRDARVVQEPGSTPNRVVVTGQDGTTARVTAGQLQDFLNRLAPELFPQEFPGPRRDGGRLPTTVPSSRFRIEVTADRVVLHGRGWGHAVGMGQYGAKGKADRGMDHVEILSTYYNGVTPTTTPRMPDRIRVGLDDSAEEVTITADGRMRVTAGSQRVTDRAFGTWRVRSTAEGGLRLLAPSNYGAALAVEPTTTSRAHPLPVETLTLETSVTTPTELVVQVARDGEPVGRHPVDIVDAGRHQVPWNLDTAQSGSLPPGSYEVALLGIAEDGTTAGSPTTIQVQRVRSQGRPQAALPVTSELQVGGTRVPATGVALGAVAGLLAGAVLARRSGSAR